MLYLLLVFQTVLRQPDYDQTGKYLAPGSQSRIGEENVEVVRREIGTDENVGRLEMAGRIHHWMKARFTTRPAGGATVGRTDVNQLLQSRVLTGCHDWGLVFASVLRLYGCPALMVDTAGIDWARSYKPGNPMVGHVFVETYIEGRWILIDPTSGRLIRDYQPSHRVIPLPVYRELHGFYVLCKGIDPADYGVCSIDSLHAEMLHFAARVERLNLQGPRYTVQQLPALPGSTRQ